MALLSAHLQSVQYIIKMHMGDCAMMRPGSLWAVRRQCMEDTQSNGMAPAPHISEQEYAWRK